MKISKKNILIGAVCASLLAVTAFGTLAYFTAKGEAENKFMVAGYDPDNPDKEIDPDKLFSVTVKETDPESGEKTTSGITYKNIMPGETREKDPTVVNTGKYSQWVRVKVTLTKADVWEKAGITDLNSLANGIDTTKWEPDKKGLVKDGDTLVWTYYLKSELAPEDDEQLFESVTIPATLTKEDMAALNGFELTVAAEAIQSKNTGGSAEEAFTNYWTK